MNYKHLLVIWIFLFNCHDCLLSTLAWRYFLFQGHLRAFCVLNHLLQIFFQACSWHCTLIMFMLFWNTVDPWTTRGRLHGGFLSMNTVWYWECIFSASWLSWLHALSSSFLRCKNTVYNTYHVQNGCSSLLSWRRLLVNSRLSVVKLLGSQVEGGFLAVPGVSTPPPCVVQASVFKPYAFKYSNLSFYKSFFLEKNN